MKQHLGAKKIEQKIVPPCLQCTSLSLQISAIKHSQKKTYKVNIKLQINSIETNLYVLSTYTGGPQIVRFHLVRSPV